MPTRNPRHTDPEVYPYSSSIFSTSSIVLLYSALRFHRAFIHEPVQYPASEHSPHFPRPRGPDQSYCQSSYTFGLAEQIYIFFELQQRGGSWSRAVTASGEKRMAFHVTSSLSNGCGSFRVESLSQRQFQRFGYAFSVCRIILSSRQRISLFFDERTR